LSDLDKFMETRSSKPTHKKRKTAPPDFQSGIYYSEKTGSGEIVSEPQKTNSIDWDEQLKNYFGDDYTKYQVIPGTAEIRFWDSNVGSGNVERLYYFKAKIQSRESTIKDEDFKKLLNEAKRIKKPQKLKLDKGKTFVICLSDWQIGKEGSEKTIDRWMKSIPILKDQIKSLRKYEPINELFLAGLGDIVEGCTGFYDQQEFTVMMDYRQQQKVARRMVHTAIKELAPLFDKTTVAFIGGNHGEPRKNGRSFTTFGDNRDVMLAEELEEIFKESTLKNKIDFIIPDQDLTLTINVSDTIVTLAHGHQMRTGGTNSQAKARTWLSNQSLARSEIADTDVLLMGHFHFFSAYSVDGDRLIAQAPSLDSGSVWFDNVYGGRNGSGILTLVLGGSEKWSNLRVIR